MPHPKPLHLALAAPLLASTLVRADPPPPDLRALLLKYRCDVFDRLVQIHDFGDPRSDADRFISISVPGGHYVQCLFHDGTRKLLCEAASGFGA